MLIPFALSPNIFNFEGLEQAEMEELLLQLNLLKMLIRTKGVVLIDSLGFLKNEIDGFIEDIPNQNIKRRTMEIFTDLAKNSFVEINTKELELEMEQYCRHFFSLLQQVPDIFAIYGNKNCTNFDCITCHSNMHIEKRTNLYYIMQINEEIMKRLVRSSIISINDYPLEDFKNEILKNLILYSKELYIFDNQMIPDIKEQNLEETAFDIKSNYKINLEYWMAYINEINPNLQVYLYLSVKLNQIKIKNEIKNKFIDFKKKLQKQIPSLNLKFRIIEESKEQGNIIITPHQRYFISDKIALSCDRGIDLLDRNHKLRDFNISLVNPKDKVMIKNYLEINSVLVNEK